MRPREQITERLSEMSVGESITLPLREHNAARCSANYLKRTYGCVFSVRKRNEDIEVTLLRDSEGDLEVDEALLRRNGFRRIGNGSMMYEAENLYLSYNVAHHRLVFGYLRHGKGTRKESGTIELRHKTELQMFLDLLDLKFNLK